MDCQNFCLNKLAFIHIPKTAGLSLHAELERHFGKKYSIRFGDNAGFDRFSSILPSELKSYNYITGHITVNDLLEKGVCYPTIAVVRDPLKRLVSMQHYLASSTHEDHRHIEFQDFNQLLQYLLKSRSFNIQCYHLTGPGNNNYESAIKSIEENRIFVVPLEYYQDLLLTLSDLLGARLENKQINITNYKASADLGVFDHDLIETIIGDDKRLYEYIKVNYLGIKSRFVQSLAD